MERKTLNDWIKDLHARFDERELKYMSVHKAKILLQLEDVETGGISLHDLDYRSDDAQDLRVVTQN